MLKSSCSRTASGFSCSASGVATPAGLDQGYLPSRWRSFLVNWIRVISDAARIEASAAKSWQCRSSPVGVGSVRAAALAQSWRCGALVAVPGRCVRRPAAGPHLGPFQRLGAARSRNRRESAGACARLRSPASPLWNQHVDDGITPFPAVLDAVAARFWLEVQVERFRGQRTETLRHSSVDDGVRVTRSALRRIASFRAEQVNELPADEPSSHRAAVRRDPAGCARQPAARVPSRASGSSLSLPRTDRDVKQFVKLADAPLGLCVEPNPLRAPARRSAKEVRALCA